MADVVRSKKPSTHRRTPEGGAPAAPRSAAEAQRLDAAEPRIDVQAVNDLLLGSWAAVRRQSREMIKDSAFWQIPGQPMAEHRARALEQLQLFVKAGASARAFPKEYGGHEDPGANVAGFQELVLADPSMQIKAGVQWGLFGAAIHQLGTKKHHDRWLRDVISLDLPGAFAMTEMGHGSDVAAVGTTATYDPQAQEFVVNTPFRAATKEFLGNAALHAQAATVFAQLITGGVNYGVHCFFVPVRDKDGALLPGVTAEDDGVKGGLNGIDNGRLAFDHVRVSRENLLNRYGDVAADGTYSSEIESPGRRFFTMLGALVQGRVSLDGAATVGTALALHIAVTYANQRRQFSSGEGSDEVVLLDYGEHQRRLLPRLAQVYAQYASHEKLLRRYDGVFSGRTDTPDERQDLETLAAALKPLSTWNALETIQVCREACGGAGFMAENRLVGLHHDLDVYATFEGDNTVLLQLVGKRLLSDVARQLKAKDAAGLARFAVQTTAGRVFHGVGLRQLGQTVADFGSTARSVELGLRAEQQHQLLAGRVEQMVIDLATALRPASSLSPADAADLFNRHQHSLIEAARAHGELLQWEAFAEEVEQIGDDGTRQVLVWLRDLFGLTLIERHLAWYLMNGRLSAQRAASVSRYIGRLCARLRPHAQDLVDAFGFAPEHVRAPIALGGEAERQDEARAHYADLAASGAEPVGEKEMRRRAKAAR